MIEIRHSFLRRYPDGPTFFQDDHRLSGTVFDEYMEIWVKDDGDDDGKTKRRTLQWPTGRQMQYIDRVTPEFLEDLGIVDPLPGIHHVFDPNDFTVHRFKIS